MHCVYIDIIWYIHTTLMTLHQPPFIDVHVHTSIMDRNDLLVRITYLHQPTPNPHNSLLKGNVGMSAYSMSKAAVIGLVKSAGKEYAETGITINAIAPAVVRTAMVEALDPQVVKYMTDKIPMKRYVGGHHGNCNTM